jgi:uncharacterized protein
MEEFTGWLCNEFNPSAINFEILSSSELTNAANLFPPDPFEFAVNFQKSRVIAEKYGIDLIYSSDIIQNPVVSSCPVGKDTAIISPDGRISNCYLMPEKWVDIGLDLDFGAISQSGVVRINEEKIGVIRKMVEDKPRCSNCFCKWSCAGGCHVGITFPGCDPVYDNHCLQTRLISAFTLLSGLGLPEKINQLMENPEAMHRLAFYESDSLKTHTDPTRE